MDQHSKSVFPGRLAQPGGPTKPTKPSLLSRQPVNEDAMPEDVAELEDMYEDLPVEVDALLEQLEDHVSDALSNAVHPDTVAAALRDAVEAFAKVFRK